MMIAITSFAQNTLVVSLSHGDETQMFYGTDAFKDAHQAAVNGDVITLSSGTFNSPTITKAITVRGAGMDNPNPTITSVTINIPDDVTEKLLFEGCRLNGITFTKDIKNVVFLKDSIGSFRYNNHNVVNGRFVNCQIRSLSIGASSSVHIINSYITGFSNNDNGISTASFINSVVSCNSSSYLNNSIFFNCIMYGLDALPLTAHAINCVCATGNNTNMFSNLGTSKNCSYADKDIFVDSNYMNPLTDEAKAKYIGDDGTPVGMHDGGPMPWNSTPSYPRISKLNVASRATAEGKLSVEIEVSNAK